MPSGSRCPPGTTGDSQEAGSSQRQIASVRIVLALNAGLRLVVRNVYNDVSATWQPLPLTLRRLCYTQVSRGLGMQGQTSPSSFFPIPGRSHSLSITFM